MQEERQVMNDNCVSYRTLKLQIPASPMRAHFVKARVKVHVYPDGSHALFQRMMVMKGWRDVLPKVLKAGGRRRSAIGLRTDFDTRR